MVTLRDISQMNHSCLHKHTSDLLGLGNGLLFLSFLILPKVMFVDDF